MFKRKHVRSLMKAIFSTQPVSPFGMEGLEDRRLLSGGGGHHHGGGGGGGGGGGDFGGGFDGGHSGATIQFSQAPSAVQTGLDNLASTDGVSAPTSTQSVILGNSGGVETYTVDIVSSGTDTKLTVDQNGNAVTAPTKSTTTFGAITNTAVTNELTAIATALGLTAPASTTSVNVVTASDGTSTYSVNLGSSSSTSSGKHGRHGGGGTTISVDSNGNPVGNERVPLSTLSAAIQNGLTSNAPAGATALTSSSLIQVRTQNGVTTYSATYTSTGTRTTVTVNSAGQLTNLPTTSLVQFSTIPAAAQSELQALATADGAGTIAATQSVSALDEANGTTIYTVRLSATDSSGSTETISISVDQHGNPTVPPRDEFFGGGGGGCDTGSTSSGTTTTTTTGSSTSTTSATSARRRRR